MKYDRIFERNKLESSVDFLKNRSGSHSDRFFSGNILRPEDHEAEAGSQSSTGRDPYSSAGTSSYSGWIFSATDLQPEKALRKLSFDIKIVQTWKGCVVAAAVIAFPLMYRNARAAFEQVDINLIHAGQTLGMSDSRIFWRKYLAVCVNDTKFRP